MNVHCNNLSFGTFLYSLVSDIIEINQLQYTIPAINLNQFNHPLIFGHQSMFGKIVKDSIDPHMYITNQTFNQNIANIPITMLITKNILIGTYLNFDCQNLLFNITINKVKPLH